MNLVVPSKRGGCSEVASKGVGRCSFTILHNPHNNTSKNNLTLYHKIQRTPKWTTATTTTTTQLRKWKILSDFKFQDTYAAAIDDVFFVVVRRVLRFQFKVFLIWCWMCFVVHRSTIFIEVFSPWFYEVASSDELQMWLPRGNEDRVNHIDAGILGRFMIRFKFDSSLWSLPIWFDYFLRLFCYVRCL